MPERKFERPKKRAGDPYSLFTGPILTTGLNKQVSDILKMQDVLGISSRWQKQFESVTVSPVHKMLASSLSKQVAEMFFGTSESNQLIFGFNKQIIDSLTPRYSFVSAPLGIQFSDTFKKPALMTALTSLNAVKPFNLPASYSYPSTEAFSTFLSGVKLSVAVGVFEAGRPIQSFTAEPTPPLLDDAIEIALFENDLLSTKNWCPRDRLIIAINERVDRPENDKLLIQWFSAIIIALLAVEKQLAIEPGSALEFLGSLATATGLFSGTSAWKASGWVYDKIAEALNEKSKDAE